MFKRKIGTEQSWARFSFQGQKRTQALNASKEVTKANALINPKTGPILLNQLLIISNQRSQNWEGLL